MSIPLAKTALAASNCDASSVSPGLGRQKSKLGFLQITVALHVTYTRIHKHQCIEKHSQRIPHLPRHRQRNQTTNHMEQQQHYPPPPRSRQRQPLKQSTRLLDYLSMRVARWAKSFATLTCRPCKFCASRHLSFSAC